MFSANTYLNANTYVIFFNLFPLLKITYLKYSYITNNFKKTSTVTNVIRRIKKGNVIDYLKN